MFRTWAAPASRYPSCKRDDLEDLKTKVLMYAPFGIGLLIALLLNLLKILLDYS
jgi:hypothetical protein